MLNVTFRGWAVVLIGFLVTSACGQDDLVYTQSRRTLDVVPPGIQTSKKLSDVDLDDELTLQVSLPLRNLDSLERFLHKSVVAGEAHGFEPMPHARFQDDFHPLGHSVREVQRLLRGQNLDVDDEAHGTLLKVRGRVRDIQAAFGVVLNWYEDPFGKRYRAPSVSAEIVENLEIEGVHGLSNLAAPQSFLRDCPPSQTLCSGVARSATQALLPQSIRDAYQIPALSAGASARVGLLQLSGYDAHDIASYAEFSGQPNPPITTILVDTPQADLGSAFQAECTADIEMVMAAIPNVSEIRLYTGPSWASEQQLLDLYNEMASPTRGDRALFTVLSTSYGQLENQLSASDLNSKNAIFMQMAAQGQTLFAAAGDSGAFADGNHLTVIDPAIEPWVTGVGGTYLQLDAQGMYSSEVAWTDGGGGASSFFAMPSYQVGLVSAGGNRSLSMRNSPDVALNADPNAPFRVQFAGRSSAYGGTSLSAPLWASIWAIGQAERERLNMPALAHFNTVLYGLVRRGLASGSLHDVMQGDNGYYAAEVGYDDATGLGSPQAALLLQLVASSYAKRTIRAPSWNLAVP